MTLFLYRRGDGNDGNFPRLLVDIAERDSIYAALPALVANDYIAGSLTRRHIIRNFELEHCGDREFGLQGCVLDGPNGETAYGAAWLTAELQPVSAEDADHMTERHGTPYALRDVLDNAALRLFRKLNREED